MQKNRRITLSVAIGLWLALIATHLWSTGWLQSSIVNASLGSCQRGSVISLERCTTPLTTEKNRAQESISTLTTQIQTKKTECSQFQSMKNKAKQLNTCYKQLANLERKSVGEQNKLIAANLSLSKLVSEMPLQTQRSQLQTQIESLKTQITIKRAECKMLWKQKNSASAASSCSAQLATLNQTRSTQNSVLVATTAQLKKIAGTVAPLPTTSASTPSPTPPASPGVTPPPAIPIPAPVVIPLPVIPPAPVITNPISTSESCDDPTICNVSRICDNPGASNYQQEGECTVQTQMGWCTFPGLRNYNPIAVFDDGSCDYTPEVIMGCTNPDAHNFAAGANTQGDSVCETCGDGIKNGDEQEKDCGWDKCQKCPDGSKSDMIDTDVGPLTEPEPTHYCDVPSAANYEEHDDEGWYQADANVCNFCGNGKTDGIKKSDGTITPVEFRWNISRTSVTASESCDDGKNDKPYDGCYQCRLETCMDELALCRAYKFKGDEGEDELSSKLTDGIDDNSYSKRPGWNNHGVDVITTRGRDFATFGSTCIRDKNKKIVSYTGYRTVFALNLDWSIDKKDSWWGAPDYGNLCQACLIKNLNLFMWSNSEPIYTGQNGTTPTRNKIIRGVAVPKEMLREIFGTDVNYRRVRVDVTGPNGCFRYPVVDEWPHEYTWARKCSAILDMTYAAAAEMWLLADTIKPTDIKWIIRENAGEDFRNRLTTLENISGLTSTSYNNDNGYKYRKNTQIDYPDEYFKPTRC